MNYSLEMLNDGDIVIYEHKGDTKKQVMHISYNPEDSLLENLIFAYFALIAFDWGFTFADAAYYARGKMVQFPEVSCYEPER